jgi:enoyl-CoA hydratase/carnithine racemase
MLSGLTQRLGNIRCTTIAITLINNVEKELFMSQYETISIEKKGQVDWLTLNRPESLNAINTPMVTELRDYFGGLKEDANTRIVVMRGAGRAFCAGLDIKSSQSREYDVPFGGGMGFQGYLAEVYIRMRNCPQPIISLIQGPACGGGFAFALASDIRIAGESARMNAAFIRVGLSACDMGASYFLPRLIGTSIASELMLTGRFIDAERALRTNLVSEVVPDDELAVAAQSYIDDMLTTSPMGLRLTKEGLNVSIDAAGLEAQMAVENRNQVLCSKTNDAKEGMTAFLEKRAPNYTGT